MERSGGPASIWNVFPFRNLFYFLNDIALEHAGNEKDLGMIVNSRLNWDEHGQALLLKASSTLGLMRRTLHFVKDVK